MQISMIAHKLVGYISTLDPADRERSRSRSFICKTHSL